MKAEHKYLYLLMLFLLLGCGNPIKRALRALEKTKYEKAEHILDKRVEKDSLTPGAFYAYSLLFSTSDYSGYNIDSSHHYIIKALDQYPNADKRTVRKLRKSGINDSIFLVQKLKVDSLAFHRALQENTINDYQYFIDHFSTAPQVPKAKEIRNEMAYENARHINTYEAYKSFLDAYPDAKQIREANEMYEFLLYENKTKDRKLFSYISFLKEHPHTNYTANAQKNIFEISTVNSQPEDYVNFINSYPNNQYVKRAIDFLYHIFKAEENPLNFLKTFQHLPLSDSLKKVAALENQILLPVYEDDIEQYGFMNGKGDIVIPPVYDAIKNTYLCGNIQSDYLIVGKNEDKKLIARNNLPVITASFSSVRDLGYGMLRLSDKETYGLYHKSGEQILKPEYQAIELLGHQYIKFKQNGKWGLKTFAGRNLLKAEYDDIYREGDFIVVEKYGLVAVTNGQVLANRANGEEVNLKFRYDEVEQMSNAYLFAYYKDQEAVLDTALNAIIPLDQHQISLLKDGWLLKEDQRYYIYNEAFVPYTNATLDKALFNDQWLALKRADKWTLLEQEGNMFPEFKYDSVRLLSEGFALTFNKDSTIAHFSSGAEMLLPSNVSVQLLRYFTPKGLENKQYLIVENKNRFKQVYDIRGKQILSGSYRSIATVGPHLISVERHGKKGLADTTGQIVLPMRYDGIGNYENGDVALLKGKKFGLYNYKQNIFIEPEYDVVPQRFGSAFFIASKNGKLGLIDQENKTVAPFQFDEIRNWSDSLILTKSGKQWSIYNFYEDQVQYGPFVQFKVVKESDEENILVILKESRYGVLSSKRGEVIPPVYSDVLNLGSANDPIYYTEREIEGAAFFEVTYFNGQGKKIRQQAMANEDYHLIYCE